MKSVLDCKIECLFDDDDQPKIIRITGKDIELIAHEHGNNMLFVRNLVVRDCEKKLRGVLFDILELLFSRPERSV